MEKSRLVEHYNKKYSDCDLSKVKPIHVKGYPLDRYEASVFWGGKGDNLLEVGPGTGEVLLTLSGGYQRCLGVELSDTRAQKLKKLFSGCKDINIITGDIEEIAFDLKEDDYDTVIMNAVVEHLIEPISTLRQMYRILKPGGRIIIITPNIAKWTRRVKLVFGRFPSTGSLNEGLTTYGIPQETTLLDEGHLHYFTYRSMKVLLKGRIGFTKVESRGFGKPVLLTRFLPNLFSECLIIGIK